MRTSKTVITLLICLLLPLIVGGISGFATATGIQSWYATLHKPSFNPPNYLFGPVWSFLYILMGVSLYIVWINGKGKNRIDALRIFTIQLTLNFLWSFLFFKFNLIGVAMLDILLIWITILLMIMFFSRVSKIAAYLQIPYLLWVTFASTLNGAIWLLN